MLFSVACPPQSSTISEPDWFSTLNEAPLIFGRSIFDEDSFLINKNNSFTYGCGIGQFICEESNPNMSSLEGVAFQHEAFSGSGEAKNFTSRVPVPGRARSKRTRSGVRAWSTGMLLNCSSPTNSLDSSTGPSSLTTVTKHHQLCQSEIQSTEENAGLQTNLSYIRAMTGSPSIATPFYKLRKPQESLQPRRCAHCQTQKTPQWRAGPTGPKTLCNACGVRYKSGRLFPEYRPAKSPTFSTHKHSNSHKKVMEMRVHKKMVDLLQGQGEDNIQVMLKGEF
eukprot:c18659_g1_i3 orf=1957-2796(+)